MLARDRSAVPLAILVRQGAVGAAGAFVAFLLWEPAIRAREHSIGASGDFLSILTHAFLWGASMAALIAASLVFGDELGSGRWARIVRRTLLAVLAGSAIGAAAGIAGQILYSLLGALGLMLAARAIGWALLGAGVGLAGGLVSWSVAKALQGLLGGAVGGLVGGLLFDLIGELTQEGTTSRLVGMVLMGACTGIAVAMAQEIAKRAWLTVLTGRGEGTRYILNKPEFVIGRAELADLPLFGDSSIDRAQAVVRAEAGGYAVHEVGAAGLLRVDGHPAPSAWLRDGSMLELGRHRLRFSSKDVPAGAPEFMQQPSALLDVAPSAPMPPMAAGFGAVPAAASEPVGAGVASPSPGAARAIRLRAEAGPHAGTVFDIPLTGGHVGRALENEISFATDAMVSRQHAEVFPEDGGCVLRDLGSRNGIMVNGERIGETWIHPGDEIRLGAGVYRVEEGS